MATTINQLKENFKEVADAHKMVGNFYWGSPDRIAKEIDVEYPLVCAWQENVRLDVNMTEYTIRLVCVDKIYKDWNKNLDEVHSDCALILRDFYRIFNRAPKLRKLWRIDNSPNGQFFTLHDKGPNDNADYVAGVYVDVNIVLRDKSGVCDIPLEDFSMR